MRLIIEPDYEKVSEWAANYVASRIIASNPTTDRPFVLGLPTGSSPLGMYRHLIRMYEEGKVSFRHVVTFNMDEYCGLSEDHAQSYHYFMHENFFRHIDIPTNQINIPNGNASDLQKECEGYEERIKHYGGIDLFVGGVGTDGHIAFNEPGSSLKSRTRIKTLTSETIESNARFFGGRAEDVPRQAITVGVGTIMDARNVMLIVNGQSKSRALHKGIEGGISQMWTISALQMHPQAIIIADEAACSELKVGTYRYYKDIEAVNIDPASQLIV